MNKLATGLLVIGVTAVLAPAGVRATDTTSAGTTPDGVPDKCYEYDLPDGPAPGPSRNAHYTTPDYPDCDDVEGICVEVFPTDGPSRIAHQPATEVDTTEVDTTEVPCVPIDDSCDLTATYSGGPARAVHHVGRPMPAPPSVLIDIPAACEEALSEALVPAGSDSGTIVWLAALLVGVGGALVVTRRAIAIRTR